MTTAPRVGSVWHHVLVLDFGKSKVVQEKTIYVRRAEKIKGGFVVWVNGCRGAMHTIMDSRMWAEFVKDATEKPNGTPKP